MLSSLSSPEDFPSSSGSMVVGKVFLTPFVYDGPDKSVWRYVSGRESQFNGADLIVESNHRLIVVTIQYRLGLFGFLAGEAVKYGGALNVGLREFLAMGKRQYHD